MNPISEIVFDAMRAAGATDHEALETGLGTHVARMHGSAE